MQPTFHQPRCNPINFPSPPPIHTHTHSISMGRWNTKQTTQVQKEIESLEPLLSLDQVIESIERRDRKKPSNVSISISNFFIPRRVYFTREQYWIHRITRTHEKMHLELQFANIPRFARNAETQSKSFVFREHRREYGSRPSELLSKKRPSFFEWSEFLCGNIRAEPYS